MMKKVIVLIVAVLMCSALSTYSRAGFEPGFDSYRCSLHNEFPGFVRLDVNNQAQCISILMNQFPHLWDAHVAEGHSSSQHSATPYFLSASKSSATRTEIDATHCVTIDPTY